MSKSKVLQITKDVAQKVKVSDITSSDLNATAIIPYRKATNTYQNMLYYLRESFMNGEKTGFEITYNGGQTIFQLLTENRPESASDENMRENFSEEHTEVAEVDDVETRPKHNFEIGDYVSTAEFSVTKDMWHPIEFYDSYTSEKSQSNDALTSIIKSISRNQRTDENITLQLIADPVNQSKYNTRRPITHLFEFFKHLLIVGVVWFGVISMVTLTSAHFVLDGSYIGYVLALMILYILVIVIFGFTGNPLAKSILELTNFRSRQFNLEQTINNIQREYNNSKYLLKSYYKGYEVSDYLDELSGSVDALSQNPDDSKSGAKKSMLQESINRVKRKFYINSEQRPAQYAVTIRLLVTGKNKESVEIKTEEICESVATELSASDGVGQELTYTINSNYTNTINTFKDIYSRNDVVDYHNRLENNHSKVYRLLNKERNKPLVLSVDEIATFMHMPSKDVTDNSVKRRDNEPEGETNPDQPSF